MATTIAIKNVSQYFGRIDKIPGNPPTPIDAAIVPVDTEIIAAKAEPVIPQTNGNVYFKLTPNNAGSVTPK